MCQENMIWIWTPLMHQNATNLRGAKRSDQSQWVNPNESDPCCPKWVFSLLNSGIRGDGWWFYLIHARHNIVVITHKCVYPVHSGCHVGRRTNVLGDEDVFDALTWRVNGMCKSTNKSEHSSATMQAMKLWNAVCNFFVEIRKRDWRLKLQPKWLRRPPFGVRSCEVAIIWPDSCKNNFPNTFLGVFIPICEWNLVKLDQIIANIQPNTYHVSLARNQTYQTWPNGIIFHLHLDFPEIKGFPILNHHLGAQVVWGRYNLTRDDVSRKYDMNMNTIDAPKRYQP